MWERILTEVEIMPNAEALRLHWLRACWVFKFWLQADIKSHSLLPSLLDYGWKLNESCLECVWDSETNFQQVEQTINWYTKGCACRTGCSTNRCKCRKSKMICGPGCKCFSCQNIELHDVENSDNVDISLSENSFNVEHSFVDPFGEVLAEIDSDDEFDFSLLAEDVEEILDEYMISDEDI